MLRSALVWLGFAQPDGTHAHGYSHGHDYGDAGRHSHTHGVLGTVLSMIGIYRGLVDDALALVRTPAADVWVVEAGTRGPFAESSRLSGGSREAIARIAGVTAAGSVTYQSIEAVHRHGKMRIYVVGYEPGRLDGPSHLITGRMITRSHFEAVADRRTGLAVGDRLPLGRDTFTIVGLTDNQSLSAARIA